jgi:ketosteroid isomerase-like protein
MTDGSGGGPRQGTNGEGARGASVEDVVLTANTAFYNAFEAGDLDLMAAVWLPEPDPVCIHPGNAAIYGYAEMMRAWAMIFANTPYIQFFLTDVQVRVDEDVAYFTCTENVLSSGEGAPEEGFAGGKALATNVFRKTSTGWRLWIHHASPVLSSGGQSEEAP